MEKRTVRGIYIAILVCAVCLSAIIITISYVLKTEKQEPTEWVLASYGDNVALYNENEVVEVYGSISLENLPVADRERIKKGIVFPSKSEAELAVEDYDG